MNYCLLGNLLGISIKLALLPINEFSVAAKFFLEGCWQFFFKFVFMWYFPNLALVFGMFLLFKARTENIWTLFKWTFELHAWLTALVCYFEIWNKTYRILLVGSSEKILNFAAGFILKQGYKTKERLRWRLPWNQ